MQFFPIGMIGILQKCSCLKNSNSTWYITVNQPDQDGSVLMRRRGWCGFGVLVRICSSTHTPENTREECKSICSFIYVGMVKSLPFSKKACIVIVRLTYCQIKVGATSLNWQIIEMLLESTEYTCHSITLKSFILFVLSLSLFIKKLNKRTHYVSDKHTMLLLYLILYDHIKRP